MKKRLGAGLARVWRAAAWGLTALAVALLAYRAALVPGQTLYQRDIHLQWYGQIETAVHVVRSGAWPLWDPWTAFGQPLLANANNELLYPPTWLNFFLEPWTYFTIFAIGHAVIGALGTQRLARALGLGRAAALFAGLIWSVSGPMLSACNLWAHYAGVAWIPWAGFTAIKCNGSARSVAIAGLPFAATVLAGSPEAFVMAAFVAVSIAAARAAGALGAQRSLAPLARWAASLAAGCALSAAQLIPTIAAARAGTRSLFSAAERSFWALPVHAIPLALLPLSWEDLPLGPGWRQALYGNREPLFFSLYLGLAGLPLVGAALAAGGALARVLALLAVLTGAYSLGEAGFVYPAVVTVLPPLQLLRFPAKALLLTALVLALLTGVGVDALRRSERRKRLTVAVALASLPAALLLGLAAAAAMVPTSFATWLAGTPVPENAARMLLREPLAAVSLGAVASVVAAASAVLALRRGSGRWAATAGAIAVADLLLAHRALCPTAPVDLYTAPPPLLAYVRQTDQRRLYVYDYDAEPGLAERHLRRHDAWRLRSSQGPPWLEAAAMRSYLLPPIPSAWQVFQGYDVDALRLYPPPLRDLNSLLRRAEGTPLHARLLRLGAVSQMVALHRVDGLPLEEELPSLFPEPIRLHRVENPLPRAYLVREAMCRPRAAVLATLAEPWFDPTRTVVIEAEGADCGSAVTSASAGPAQAAEIAELGANRAVVRTNAAQAAWLVLVDVHAQGWGARIDGVPASVRRANGAFRAVQVPAGVHEVEFVYLPDDVRWGVAISLVAIGLFGWSLKRT